MPRALLHFDKNNDLSSLRALLKRNLSVIEKSRRLHPQARILNFFLVHLVTRIQVKVVLYDGTRGDIVADTIDFFDNPIFWGAGFRLRAFPFR
jgi:hypothetical protein